jgi:hypothetical protein
MARVNALRELFGMRNQANQFGLARAGGIANAIMGTPITANPFIAGMQGAGTGAQMFPGQGGGGKPANLFDDLTGAFQPSGPGGTSYL